MDDSSLNIEEEQRKEEWREIEDLVISFQKQFKENCTEKEKKYILTHENTHIKRKDYFTGKWNLWRNEDGFFSNW